MPIINISDKTVYPDRKFGGATIYEIMPSTIKVGINTCIHDFLWYIDKYRLNPIVYLNHVYNIFSHLFDLLWYV